MNSFFIENRVNSITVKNIDGLLFRINVKKSIFKYTYTYYNNLGDIFLIMDKYDYLLFIKKKVRFTAMKFKPIFYKYRISYIMSFKNKDIRFSILDCMGKNTEVYINKVKIGIIKKNNISQYMDEYEFICNGSSEDILLSSVSFCSNLTFNFN